MSPPEIEAAVHQQLDAPADFVIVDLDRSWQVRDEDLKTRSKNSPYEHRTLTGRAVETVVAGRSVWRNAGTDS